jgi:hypothetical protein
MASLRWPGGTQLEHVAGLTLHRSDLRRREGKSSGLRMVGPPPSTFSTQLLEFVQLHRSVLAGKGYFQSRARLLRNAADAMIARVVLWELPIALQKQPLFVQEEGVAQTILRSARCPNASRGRGTGSEWAVVTAAPI